MMCCGEEVPAGVPWYARNTMRQKKAAGPMGEYVATVSRTTI